MRSWRRELETEFLASARLIRGDGIVEPWPLVRPKYHMHYLVVDGDRYWALGDIDPTTIAAGKVAHQGLPHER